MSGNCWEKLVIVDATYVHHDAKQLSKKWWHTVEEIQGKSINKNINGKFYEDTKS